MTYVRGNCMISVQQIDGCGKTPGLFVGTQNEYHCELSKVASFANEDKAKLFEKWMDYLCFGEKEEQDESL